MPSLTQLREEFDAKSKNLHDIFARFPEVTDMPADEAKKIKPMNDELSKLGKEIEDAEELLGIKAAIERQPPRAVPAIVTDPHRKSDAAPAVKSFEQVFSDAIETPEAKAFFASKKGTFSFDLGEAESKTLMTLSTINAVATRLPGIQESIQDSSDVTDLFLQSPTSANTITYMEETTFTNAAAETAEGESKPESALAFTERTENVRKIPTWIPATTEMLDDVPGIRGYIEGRLAFMVRQREAGQLLVGNGTAPNISGILDRSIQTQAKGTDPTPDAVYKAMQKVRVTGDAEPTGVVFHPNDWTDIRLLRTADGIYIWGSPSDPGPERIWGKPVRQTPKMTENTGLVGAFKPFAQIFRREGITITISTEHSTYFIENKVAILAEERLALAVYRPYAFCSVTGI